MPRMRLVSEGVECGWGVCGYQHVLSLVEGVGSQSLQRAGHHWSRWRGVTKSLDEEEAPTEGEEEKKSRLEKGDTAVINEQSTDLPTEGQLLVPECPSSELVVGHGTSPPAAPSVKKRRTPPRLDPGAVKQSPCVTVQVEVLLP